jgi:hypothetical protein
VAERRADGKTSTTSYDLHKDSLPVVNRTTPKQDLARVIGILEISVSGVPRSQQKRVRELLGRLES